MKNIMKLSLIALSFAALAGCSTVSSTLGLGGSSDDVNTSEAVKAPEVSADSSAPTAKVSLMQNDKDQIVATIYTNYNNNPEGSIKLQWKAPEGTSCYDTSFPIAKYGEKNDKTWASVEIKQGDKFCKGDWTANVVFDQDVIATDTISVS
jgi:hypothetical protein